MCERAYVCICEYVRLCVCVCASVRECDQKRFNLGEESLIVEMSQVTPSSEFKIFRSQRMHRAKAK